MPKEAVQRGFGYDGKGIVLWVPTIADLSAPTVAELTAGTVKRLTYGLYGPTGYSLTPTINKRVSTRYTLEQELTQEGTRSYELVLLYVYDRVAPTDAETVLGVKGVEGNIVHLLGYPNEHAIAAGTKINDIVPIRTASSVDVPATANTDAHKRTVPEIIGEVLHEVAVVAGS